MESNWADLASGVHGRIANALAVFNRHAPRDINLVQARALVQALISADATTQRAATWPQVLSLLTTWVKTLDKSGRAAVANTKRPLRPWERQQQTPATAQQGGSLVATQQQAQQSQQAQHDVLQQATTVVTSALQEAAAAAHVQGSGPRNTDVLNLLGPCITFLGAAVTAVAATAGGTQLHQQLLESSVVAVCSALIAAAPVLLGPAAAAVDESHTFSQLLLSVQHLLVACQDDDICQLWLLSCLLAAVQEALTCGLPQCIAAAASSSSCPANATLAVQQGTLWKAQRAQKLAVLQISASLKDLYSVGQALGSMFAKAIAAAASPTQQQQQQQQSSQEGLLPEFVLLQKFNRLVDLLCIGCNNGDLSLVAVTAAAAAGVVAGSLEMLPSDAAAAAAGSLGDVWATTVAAGKTVKQQQQQQQSQPAMQPAAVLDPQWLQHLKGQLSLLLHAFDSAARRCIDATGAVAAADNALPQAGALLLGYAYSKLMATHSDALRSLQQQHSTASVHCGLLYIMHHCCGLAGVMHHAGCCSDAAAANAWLAAQQQQHPPHEVASLVRWLATTVTNLPTDQQQLLLHAVRQESEQVADSYDCYIHVSQSDVLQQVNAGAVRQQLDRVFATVVALLAASWQQQQQQMVKADSSGSGGATAAAAVVGQGLAALAALQFCCVNLPAYVDLLRGLVGAVASSSGAADAFLAAAVPCYDALLRPVPTSNSSSSSCNAQCSEGGLGIECECCASSSSCCCCSSSDRNSSRAWLNSPVLIARLSFLLPLLPVACNASLDAAAAASRVLPLVLLLLPHPVQQLSHAAHAAFAGLLTAATDAMQQSEATNAQQQQQQQKMHAVVEQAIPFYLQRSVEGLPHSGSLEGLAVGFTCILKQLPADSVMSLLAVDKITQCAVQLAVEANATVAIPADTVDPKVQQEVQQQTAAVHDTSRTTDIPPRTAATAAARLFELLQMSLQLVDFRLLPSALQHISAAVLVAPSIVQNSWIKGLYGSCLATDDYARKPALMTWIDGLNKQVVQVQQARIQAAADVEHSTKQGKGADGGLKPTQPPFLVV